MLRRGKRAASARPASEPPSQLAPRDDPAIAVPNTPEVRREAAPLPRRPDAAVLARRLAEAGTSYEGVGTVLVRAAGAALGGIGALWIVDPLSRRLFLAAHGGVWPSELGQPDAFVARLQPHLRDGMAVTVDEKVLAIAIEIRGRLGAVLAVVRPRPAVGQTFGESDAAALRQIAVQAGLAVDNARLYASSTAEIAERRRVETHLRSQAVQQAALAELSQRALAGAKPVDLIRDTVTAVAETLGVPVAGIVDGRPDAPLLRAGVGWNDTGGGLDRHDLAARAMMTQEPVIVDDLAGPGVTSAAVVPIRGRDLCHGALEVFDRGRAFLPEDVAFLQAVANVVALAIERSMSEAEIRHQALHDALTGLPNRALLGDRLEHGLHAFRREHRPLALLLMDLDGFKEINDTLGHHMGDAVLCAVARRLGDVVRQTDTVARLGGDEFAMVLLGVEVDEAKAVATKVLSAVEQPLELDGVSLRPRASIGISLAPRDGLDAATLLRCADVAMYRAKRYSDGCALYDSSYDHHDVSRLALAAELREAIDEGQLICHYQPIVDLGHRGVVSVEALVRWNHPVLGLIRPDDFIPLAEETGLIRPLTRWVLDHAIAQARRWEDTGAPVAVAVNVSARMLHDPELLSTVQTALERARVAPGRLILEITESGVMTNPVTARDTIAALAALGVGIAIDDFGTGYSSLAYLQRLPVQELKVDQSFVTGMVANGTDASIVRSVIELGHSLGLSVVAEGVEGAAAAELLAALGCDLAQGYHLGGPVPAEDLGWLASTG